MFEMLSLNDRIHLTVQFDVDFLAVAANILLLVAIKTRTPATMRNYSILLANSAIIDTLSAISGCLACTRVINAPNDTTVLVFLGPCSLISHKSCLFFQTIQAGFHSQSTWLLLISFCYRLYALEGMKYVAGEMKSRRCISAGCFVTLMITALSMYLYFDIATEISSDRSIKLQIIDYAAMVLPRTDTVRAAAAILPSAMVSPSLMIFIYFIRRHLIQKIKRSVNADRDFHSRIAKTLTYHSLLPLGSVIGATYWSLDKFLGLSSEFPQRIIVMMITFICLASPIINLLYLPPYRGILRIRKTRIQEAANFHTPPHRVTALNGE